MTVFKICNLGNCPELSVADDGSVTLWDSARPTERVTFDRDGWAQLHASIRLGELDHTLTAGTPA